VKSPEKIAEAFFFFFFFSGIVFFCVRGIDFGVFVFVAFSLFPVYCFFVCSDQFFLFFRCPCGGEVGPARVSRRPGFLEGGNFLGNKKGEKLFKTVD
jgi:hypothetical protein